MVFKRGNTRWVVLTKNRAIKFARFFRPLGPLAHVSRNLFQGGISRLLEKINADRNGGPSAIGKINFFLGCCFPPGIASNRREHELYSSHPELPIAPVLAMYLGGLVLVMERGQPVASEEERVYIDLAQEMYTEALEPRHLCRFGASIKTVDYGYSNDKELLLQLFSSRAFVD